MKRTTRDPRKKPAKRKAIKPPTMRQMNEAADRALEKRGLMRTHGQPPLKFNRHKSGSAVKCDWIENDD